MKKNFLILLVVSVFPVCAMAQFKVNSFGQVAMGSETPSLTAAYTDKLNLYSDGSLDSCGLSFQNGANKPFRIYNKGSYTGYVGHHNSSGEEFYGLKMSGSEVLMTSTMSYLLPRLKPSGKYASLNVGSFFFPAIIASGSGCNTGIISVYSYSESSYGYSVYASSSDNSFVRNFYVKGDGSVYAKNGLIQSSDISKKENVNLISSRTALNSLASLQGVSFSYKAEDQALVQPVTMSSISRGSLGNEKLSELNEEQRKAYESERIPDEILAKMNEEQNRKRIGLIAQEVEEIVPEVVRTLPDGSKGIIYTDLIGLIIEGMKEMNTRIDSLERTVHFYKSLIPFTGTLPAVETRSLLKEEESGERNTKIASSLSGQVVLYQNVPNPFSASTEIVYALPEEAENPVIGIYDLNGQLLKQYILVSSAGKIIIQGDEFDAGTYIYTLNAGGQVLASRKMVKS